MKTLIFIIGIFLIAGMLFYFNFDRNFSNQIPTCEDYGVLYLRADELKYSPEATDKVGIVAIPESNRVTGRGDLISCVDPFKYLKIGGLNNAD